LECLQGKGPDDVMDLTYALGSRMLVLGEKAKSVEEGDRICREMVSSGKAMEKFLENIADQGGNPDELLANQGKRRSKNHAELRASSDGYLSVDAYKVGIACINLGVGRNKTSDAVDADSGLIFEKRQGDFVRAGEKIMDVYAKDSSSLDSGMKSLSGAVSYTSEKTSEKNLILKEIR